MTITLKLHPDIEAKLLAKAAQEGIDVSTVATQLLTQVLEWETQDTQAAIQGIQRGFDDFTQGRFRSFDDFLAEQTQKHNLES